MSDQLKLLYQHFCLSTGVCTDTRKIKKGNIFFALKGPNFDANAFAEKALNEGCCLAVIDDANYFKNAENYFLVKDVLVTLQLLANYHRKTLNTPIVGITGSNGKTTTKELTYQVLSQKYKAYATKGNFNNHIGVPLSLLDLTDQIEVAVIEMGANKPGDIKELCEIAEPDYGIITNIGKAHLEGFGSLEGVKKTKGELYDFISIHGKQILVNQNEKELLEISKEINNKIFYGDKYPLQEVNPYIVFKNIDGQEVSTHLIGSYNHQNILTALAIADLFEIDLSKAIKSIAEYVPENNRSQVIKKGGKTIVLDAYNANPSSMSSALSSFQKLKAANKMLILGEMLEMGEESKEEHKKLLLKARDSGAEAILVIGKEFESFQTQFPNIIFFNCKDELKKHLSQQDKTIDAILIKGSRGNKLEELLDYI